MKLQELLTETGDNTVPFHIAKSGPDECRIDAPDIGLMTFLTRIGGQVFIDFSVGGRQDKTGSGNAFQIFATVGAILDKCLDRFINDQDIMVTFGADKLEPSRVKLYNRLAPRVTKILGPSWRFTHGNERPGFPVKNYMWIRRPESLNEVAVASTWITNLVYTRKTKTLTMALNNGRRYAIKGISRQSFERWKDSPSKGKYFHQHIRNTFNIDRIR